MLLSLKFTQSNKQHSITKPLSFPRLKTTNFTSHYKDLCRSSGIPQMTLFHGAIDCPSCHLQLVCITWKALSKLFQDFGFFFNVNQTVSITPNPYLSNKVRQ